MTVVCEFKEGTKSFAEHVAAAARESVKSVGKAIMLAAQRRVQVDQGILRNSISVAVDDGSVIEHAYKTTSRNTTPYEWTGHYPVGASAQTPFDSEYVLPPPAVDGKASAVVGTAAEYAATVEYRDGYHYVGHERPEFTGRTAKGENIDVDAPPGPRPFMNPAGIEVTPKAARIAATEIKKYMKGVSIVYKEVAV